MLLPAMLWEQRLSSGCAGKGHVGCAAKKMGVHKSALGKWLIKCCELLPKGGGRNCWPWEDQTDVSLDHKEFPLSFYVN